MGSINHTDDDQELNLTLLMGDTEVEFSTNVTPACGCRVQARSAALSFPFSLEMCPIFLRFLVCLRVFTQKQSGGGAFNVTRTRVAVVIFERVTSFLAHSCGGRLGGWPWSSHTLFQSPKEISPVF